MSNSPLTLRLKPKTDRRIRQGNPWIYSNEIDPPADWKHITPGSIAHFTTTHGEPLGTGYINPRPLIAGRILSPTPILPDATFFTHRLRQALLLREQLFPTPYYRLVHAEADHLPGLVIDRFNDVFVCQLATAGMENLREPLTEALTGLFSPRTILFRNDLPQRALEGLSEYVEATGESLTGPTEVHENNVRYLADLTEGQKTGWFYDQRDNRAHIARLAQGKRLLDVFSHSGGFALPALAQGATSAHCVDSSALALKLAKEAATLNGFGPKLSTTQAKAFEFLESYKGPQWDIICLDPPAFIKSRKDVMTGLKGYEKLIRLAAPHVTPGGFLFLASCSHHAFRDVLWQSIASGLRKAGRTGRILRIGGAAADHPLHPMLPESEYLKAFTLQVD